MKETVLDVLRFLFEQYMQEDGEVPPDRDTLQGDLISAGFGQLEVGMALNWVENLADAQLQGVNEAQTAQLAVADGHRHYLADEAARIGPDAQGFLLYLQQMGVLDAYKRELIIDRIMALELDDHREPIDVEQIQWIVLVVLYNQPDADDSAGAFSNLEELMFAQLSGYLH